MGNAKDMEEPKMKSRLFVILPGIRLEYLSDSEADSIMRTLFGSYPIMAWSPDGHRAVINPTQTPVIEVAPIDDEEDRDTDAEGGAE